MRGFTLKLYFLILSSFISINVSAQHTDTLTYRKLKYEVKVQNRIDKLKLWNEIPPVILSNSRGYTYISSTFFSTVWRHQQNLATPTDDLIRITRRRGNGFYATSSLHWWERFLNPEFLNSSNYKHQREWQNNHWRRNYNGIFSAHILPDRGRGNIVFALSHGENKNEKVGDFFYQNSVRPDYLIKPRDPSTYSGGTPYKDCWEAYFGFLNGNWSKLNNDSTLGPTYFNDIGPVLWPSAGYVNRQGHQTSQGLRHPSSIVHNGYLYIFVIDTSMDGTGGVKIVRVLTENVLNPQRYQTWSKGGWIKALPDGFSASQVKNYFTVRGPANTPIIPNDKSTVRFSVARFQESTNRFIAVEEYINANNTIELAFRYSKDLINWSDRHVIYHASNWKVSELHYPVFMNLKGLTDGSINRKEFYILGSRDDGKLSKLHFKLVSKTEAEKDSVIYQYETNSLENQNQLFDHKSTQKKELESVRHSTPNFEKVSVFPVPSSNTLTLSFSVSTQTKVSATIYKLNGDVVGNLIEETFLPQHTQRTINISDLSMGTYILKISDNKHTEYKKIIKL
mgnify:CR=1 FL=1